MGKAATGLSDKVREAFAEWGRQGGASVKGKAKRRTKAQYRAMGLKSAAARRKKKREREREEGKT